MEARSEDSGRIWTRGGGFRKITPSKFRTRSAGWLEPQGASWNRRDGPDTEPRGKARGRDSQENRWMLEFGRKAGIGRT